MADTVLNKSGLTYFWSKIKAAFSESDHVHGNITNSGDITATATIASGDRLIINDESASQIANSSITFGTGTTTFLRNDGTWGTPDTSSSTTYYGTSNTTASTSAKSVTCSGFSLGTGVYISITFTTANTVTASGITLNVNSTGSKNVYVNNVATSSTNLLKWDANDTLLFVYDGTRYHYLSKQSANVPMTEDEIYSAFVAGWGAVANADSTSY